MLGERPRRDVSRSIVEDIRALSSWSARGVVGLEEPDRTHLLDVLERLTAAGVPARERPDEWEVAGHEVLPGADVTLLVKPPQQLAILGGAQWASVGLLHAGSPTSFSRRTTIPSPVDSSTP